MPRLLLVALRISLVVPPQLLRLHLQAVMSLGAPRVLLRRRQLEVCLEGQHLSHLRVVVCLGVHLLLRPLVVVCLVALHLLLLLHQRAAIAFSEVLRQTDSVVLEVLLEVLEVTSLVAEAVAPLEPLGEVAVPLEVASQASGSQAVEVTKAGLAVAVPQQHQLLVVAEAFSVAEAVPRLPLYSAAEVEAVLRSAFRTLSAAAVVAVAIRRVSSPVVAEAVAFSADSRRNKRVRAFSADSRRNKRAVTCLQDKATCFRVERSTAAAETTGARRTAGAAGKH